LLSVSLHLGHNARQCPQKIKAFKEVVSLKFANTVKFNKLAITQTISSVSV